MDATNTIEMRRRSVWLSKNSGDFSEFIKEIETLKENADWPLAEDIQSLVPIYSGANIDAAAADKTARQELMAEWVEVLTNGPGVIAIKGGMNDLDVVDQATAVFDKLIEEEREAGAGAGDHFAKPGANDRVWNAVEKHCVADPKNFARYYASNSIAMVSEAWLGAGYQMTAQVNRVNPGGSAQTAHRDYHLGFMKPERMQDYPAHIHGVSPLLTLQGAVAHCDMPMESGPTMFLPFSQKFFEGYLAFGRSEFQEFFAQNFIQLPLEKGDVVFFNPALMHGAGDNTSKDIYRMANLLQVSSAFGRAMEAVNRAKMIKTLYPALKDATAGGLIDAMGATNAIAASAEGYSFPTNLDLDPPVGGLAPKTQAQIMAEALENGHSTEAFCSEIDALSARQQP